MIVEELAYFNTLLQKSGIGESIVLVIKKGTRP